VMSEKMRVMNSHLQNYAKQCTHTSVKFLATDLSKTLAIEQLAFKDLIHITQAEPLASYLTQIIQEILRKDENTP
jgi:hypothetical protein